MSYVGFNHCHVEIQKGVKLRVTKSTVLDFLRLSKSKFAIVKELIRRMVILAGPDYLFCHSANQLNRDTIREYQAIYKMRVCKCYGGITFINPKSICCADGVRSARGNESGLQVMWVYRLAVYRGALRVREEKFKACELGMANRGFFLKIGQLNAQTDENRWRDLNHFYITNVRQILDPKDYVNTNNAWKLFLATKLI